MQTILVSDQTELGKIEPSAAIAATLDSFAASVGMVLFYNDQQVVIGMQEEFALYADNFPRWSEQSGGMAQFSV